jgi:hypothetical protein
VTMRGPLIIFCRTDIKTLILEHYLELWLEDEYMNVKIQQFLFKFSYISLEARSF